MDMRWKAARLIVLLEIVELSLGSAAVVCGIVAATKATEVSFYTSIGLFGFYVSKLRVILLTIVSDISDHYASYSEPPNLAK